MPNVAWKTELGFTLPEQTGIGLPVWRRGPAGSIPRKRVAAPESTRERLRALMDGRLGTAPDRSNLVLLAAQLILEEALGYGTRLGASATSGAARRGSQFWRPGAGPARPAA